MTDRQSTHADGCWDWGPKHYECAVGKIERLQAEVEKLRAEALEESARMCDALSKSGDRARALRLADECEESAQLWAHEIDTRQRAAAELRRLHAEVESLRTDAERYRWLRDKGDSITVCDCASDGEWIPLHPENIDAAIDAAMKATDDLTRCPNCKGPADNGHDREVPPNPYWCSKCSESNSCTD